MVNAAKEVFDLAGSKLCIGVAQRSLPGCARVLGLEPAFCSFLGVESLHGYAKETGETYDPLTLGGCEMSILFPTVKGGIRDADILGEKLLWNIQQFLKGGELGKRETFSNTINHGSLRKNRLVSDNGGKFLLFTWEKQPGEGFVCVSHVRNLNHSFGGSSKTMKKFTHLRSGAKPLFLSGFDRFFGLVFLRICLSVAIFLGVFPDICRDFHRAESGAAHGAEVGGLGTFGGEGFVVEIDGAGGVEAEGELVAPAELESSFRDRVVASLRGGVAFGEVGGVGGDLVGDDAFSNIVPVREAEVFLGRDVAEHGAAIPADVGGTDGGGDVVVTRRDVGGEWSEGVEGGFVAPLDLLLHVFLNEVHGNVAGAFVHDLASFFPSAGGEFALDFELGELGVVVGVGDGAGAESVADGEGDVVGGADVADVIPVGVEEVFLVMME